MPATSYTFRVRQACDSADVSNWTTSGFTTDSLPCFVPTNVNVVSATNSTATIDWATRGTETNWDVRVYNTTFDSTYTVTAHPATVGGLTAGVTYNVAVRALCGSAMLEGDYSEPVSFTTTI